MRWFIDQVGDTFLAKSPQLSGEVLGDAVVVVNVGETFKGIPYDKLEDGQIFEEDDRGVLKELSAQAVLEDIDRILKS